MWRLMSTNTPQSKVPGPGGAGKTELMDLDDGVLNLSGSTTPSGSTKSVSPCNGKKSGIMQNSSAGPYSADKGHIVSGKRKNVESPKQGLGGNRARIIEIIESAEGAARGLVSRLGSCGEEELSTKLEEFKRMAQNVQKFVKLITKEKLIWRNPSSGM